MTARCSELVAGIASKDLGTRLRSLRAVKNQIIGNKSKKLQYISSGAVKPILEALSSTSDKEVLVESAAVLGSFAHGITAGLQELLANKGLEHIARCTLDSSDDEVLKAGLRALKLVLQSPSAPREAVLADGRRGALVRHLRSDNPIVAEAAAAVAAQCCTSQQGRQALVDADALGALVQLLLSPRRATQGYALESLAFILPANPAARAQLAACARAHEVLLALLREQAPAVRLLAATVLTHLSKAAGAAAAAATAASEQPQGQEGAGEQAVVQQEQRQKEATARQELQQRVLAVLLRLLGCPETRAHVPPVLAELLADNEALQRAAAGSSVQLLAALLASEGSAGTGAGEGLAGSAGAGAAGSGPGASGSGVAAPPAVLGLGVSAVAVREGCLSALAGLCLKLDDCRKQLLEAKVLRHIVRALDDPDERVRCAAARVTMALSRTERTALRGQLLDGDVAPALCRLLADPSLEVRANAANAICNLALEFTAAKEAVLRHGGLPQLVALLSAQQAPLRLHACWALRNVVCKSTPAVRQHMMQALPWPQMRLLLSDADAGVAEQAVCVLRNLVTDREENICAVLDWSGGDMVAALEEKLDPAGPTPQVVRSHALYCVVNLLTGSEAHKDAVMHSRLPSLVLGVLRQGPAGPAELLVPACWCLINLAYGGSPAAGARCRRLAALGAEEMLRALQGGHECADVRARAKAALDEFRAHAALAPAFAAPAAIVAAAAAAAAAQ